MSESSKEFGSDFHYISEGDSIFNHNDYFQQGGIVLLFSGRVALFNLLRFGIVKYNWRVVGFPSYYCHEVVDFCRVLPIEIKYYNYNPFSDIIEDINWNDEELSVFINVHFFGVRKIDISFLKKSIVIEDLTHSLLDIRESTTDYCFASLRKQLPVAVGGVCKALTDELKFPIYVNDFTNRVALQKMSAMFLKSEYLRGNFSNKQVFRDLFVDSEIRFKDHQTDALFPDFLKAHLFFLKKRDLIDRTCSNIIYLIDNLQLKACKLLNASEVKGLGIVFVFEDSMLRDRLREYLISNNIYPAILWPNQKAANDIFFENRMLFLHADFRYSLKDIDFLTAKINNFFESV